MIKKIATLILILVAGVLVVAAFQPTDFRVARSATINAPAAQIFPKVNDMRSWEAWSPWEKIDLNMTRKFEGPAAGVGASYAWAGNMEVGEGKSTIVESRPDELIRFKLEMIKPFRGTNDVEFDFKPEGTQTTVSWSMSGQKNYIAKLIGLFLSCDKMVGDQFEKGLSQLKLQVESSH